MDSQILSFLIQSIAAALASTAFCIIFGVRGSHIIIGGLIGGVGFFAGLLLGGFSQVFPAAAASALISLLAEICARIKKAPVTLFLVGGLIPIVPGRAIYQCVFFAINGDYPAAGATFMEALLITGAIAVGIILVSSLIKLVPASKIKTVRAKHGR